MIRFILLGVVLVLTGCVAPQPVPETQMPPLATQPAPSPSSDSTSQTQNTRSPASIYDANRYVDFVIVEKARGKMFLMKNNQVVRQYDIALGKNPEGHKMQEGDFRTPEGRYTLTYKNPQSKFYKSIRIDYPNERDKMIAQARGVSPGGDIVIHGMPNRYGNYMGPTKTRNWTEGCIAVRNHEMAAIWRLVDSGTPIEIRP